MYTIETIEGAVLKTITASYPQIARDVEGVVYDDFRKSRKERRLYYSSDSHGFTATVIVRDLRQGVYAPPLTRYTVRLEVARVAVSDTEVIQLSAKDMEIEAKVARDRLT